jgi:hypothetical protein
MNPLRSNGANANDYFENNSYPHIAYANGKIFITYADLPSTSSNDRGDVFIMQAAINWSTHGLSLSSGPRKVNNDSTQTDQWDPSITASPDGNELFIGYYSRQNDPVTNSWITAYGARAWITNGLSQATFDCFPVSPTSFQPLFAGTLATSNNVYTFEPVWPASHVCVDTNDLWEGWYVDGSGILCAGGVFDFGTFDDYVHFGADDYTWSASDVTYFYFAWCDRTRKYQSTRPDADIKLSKIKH